MRPLHTDVIRSRALRSPLCASVLAMALLAPSALAAPRVAPPRDLAAAEALALQPASKDRDRALEAWAAGAALPDLMYVLRHDRAELGGAEAILARAALARVPAAERAQRLRLQARAAQGDARAARAAFGAFAPEVGMLPTLRVSPYRVGVLLPDSGDYAAYARSLMLGLKAAFDDANSVSVRPLEWRWWPTGDGDPAQVAAAFDSAAEVSGALIGELLSVPSLTLAAASRVRGLPLISPTATDERVGAVGPAVFQVGPSNARRGAMLARSMLPGGIKRVAVLLSGDMLHPGLERGFSAVAESAGAQIVMREEYPAGNLDFRGHARNLARLKPDVLLWDGESREGAALLKALAREGVSVRIGGTSSLAPDRYHAESLVMLEGVTYIEDDWQLPRGLRSRLDSLARAHGEPASGEVHARGYLAGRFLTDVVHAGATSPEAIAAALAARTEPEAGPRRGFLDAGPLGGRIALYTVVRGKAVPLP